LELRSFGFSEYLLLECFSRDFDRLRECLLLWRRLLGDFDLERERPIFSELIVSDEFNYDTRDAETHALYAGVNTNLLFSNGTTQRDTTKIHIILSNFLHAAIFLYL